MANDCVIEVQRKLHEERERIEDGIAKEMLLRKSNVNSYMSLLCDIFVYLLYRFVSRLTVSIVSEICVSAH